MLRYQGMTDHSVHHINEYQDALYFKNIVYKNKPDNFIYKAEDDLGHAISYREFITIQEWLEDRIDDI